MFVEEVDVVAAADDRREAGHLVVDQEHVVGVEVVLVMPSNRPSPVVLHVSDGATVVVGPRRGGDYLVEFVESVVAVSVLGVVDGDVVDHPVVGGGPVGTDDDGGGADQPAALLVVAQTARARHPRRCRWPQGQQQQHAASSTSSRTLQTSAPIPHPEQPPPGPAAFRWTERRRPTASLHGSFRFAAIVCAATGCRWHPATPLSSMDRAPAASATPARCGASPSLSAGLPQQSRPERPGGLGPRLERRFHAAALCAAKRWHAERRHAWDPGR